MGLKCVCYSETVSYVFLMAVVLLVLIVMGGVLTAFLYPRSIVVSVLALNPAPLHNTTSWSLQDSSDDNLTVSLGVEVQWNLSL